MQLKMHACCHASDGPTDAYRSEGHGATGVYELAEVTIAAAAVIS